MRNSNNIKDSTCMVQNMWITYSVTCVMLKTISQHAETIIKYRIGLLPTAPHL